MSSHHQHPHDHHETSPSAPSSTASTPRDLAAAPGDAHHHHHSAFPPPPPPPPARWHPDDPSAPCVRLMCSFGGRILPRPQDHQLRYVGGETRIVSVPRSCSFSSLLGRLSKLLPGHGHDHQQQQESPSVKYQLPSEDLDALISLTSDEDVENMFDELDRLSVGGRVPRLRLFLFPPPSSSSSSSAFGSVLSTCSTASDRHQWFVDALNASGGATLERGRSEASSIVSEVPDYLFGLDAQSDEPGRSAKPKTPTEPGSPLSVSSSQPSIPAITELPSLKTKRDVEEEAPDRPLTESAVGAHTGFIPNPVWSYMPEHVPVYYIPTPVHGGSLPVHQVPVPLQYVHHPLGPMAGGQIPVGMQHPFPGLVGPPVHPGPVYLAGGGGSYEYQVARSEAYETPVAGVSSMRSPMVFPMYPVDGVPVAVGIGGDGLATETSAGVPRQ